MFNICIYTCNILSWAQNIAVPICNLAQIYSFIIYLFNIDENNYKHHSKYNILKIKSFIKPVLS